VRVAPAVAKMIPDSRLLVLDQVGLVAQMERPDLVARAVLPMLDEVGVRSLADTFVTSPVAASGSPFVAIEGAGDGPGAWPVG
jgi:hypothetical protein